ncbi:flagellar protein FliT [Chengkuizengella axinellae]|uniref:Flagellar protein FliT n=1 Tax=Chengkuizengella axinellae TaxID=3064388 RepID=A0ABT9J2Q8_9BACL|nr:flagellar protein FliT [Chengkuizengella sp. 2205SS18-9]MDP5275891.1 flagellar protein FliT [Chengkuizengella sp. 2205SS18-9]
MDSLIPQLESLTKQTYDQLKSITYKELEQFVNKRESIINQMKNSGITDEQKQLFQQTIVNITRYDKEILMKMKQLKDEASQELNKIQSGRKQKSAYQNAYTADSVFFDKKK